MSKLQGRIDAVCGQLESRENDRRMRESLAILQANPRRMLPLLGMDNDKWQSDLLAKLAGTEGPSVKRAVLACGRQTGKSTLLSVYGAWLAMSGRTVAVSAPSFRQSLELSSKIRRIISRFGLVSFLKDAIVDIRLANGGRVIALPPSGTGRGFTLHALLIDEAAFLSENSDLVESLSPALAISDGQLILASSPGPPMGLLYKAWNSDSWDKTRIRCDECSRIDPEFLERQRELLGPDGYRREYLAEFVDMSGSLLSARDVDACASPLATMWLDFGT